MSEQQTVDKITSMQNLAIRNLFQKERDIDAALTQLDNIEDYFMLRAYPGGGEFNEAISDFRSKLVEIREAIWAEQMTALPFNPDDSIPF